jgi:hypothetical protein
MRIALFLAASLSLSLLAVVACGGDDDDASPTLSSTPSPDAAASPTEVAPATPTADPGNHSDSPTTVPSQTVATIGLREYAIDPEVTSARPGAVTFKVANRGEITHEFLVVRTDLAHAELPRLPDNSAADESQLDIVGRLDGIGPGTEAEITLTLSAGNFVLICNLTADGTSHYLSGMYDRFVVSENAPQAPH